tara:strand:+ start:1062 stop:1298 length:237 start_codon:yes stop_codon:yes gene_type:complete
MGITVVIAVVLAFYFPWAVLGYTFAATGIVVLVDDGKFTTLTIAFSLYIVVCIVVYALLDWKSNCEKIQAFFKKHLKE